MPLRLWSWLKKSAKKRMRKMKAVLQRLLFPPGWIVIAVSGIGYGALIPVLGTSQTGIGAWMAYTLSAYALVVDILALPKCKSALQTISARFKERSVLLSLFRKTNFGRSYLDNRAFRESISLYQGMIANFLYTVFRIITGIQYASVWFMTIAVYNLLLGIFRLYLIARYRRQPFQESNRLVYEYSCYKTIGKWLLVLHIPMSGMVVQMVVANSGFLYSGLVIYVSALYTFYMMILSVANLIRFRKRNSPILLAAKALNCISAAMSVLGLQTAMIARFGEDGSFRKWMERPYRCGRLYACAGHGGLYGHKRTL